MTDEFDLKFDFEKKQWVIIQNNKKNNFYEKAIKKFINEDD